MNKQEQQAHLTEVLDDLEAGLFTQKVTKALAGVAEAVAHTGKKGKVVIELSFKRIGDSAQVECQHTIKTAQPTAKGKIAEDNTATTPLHVGPRGKLSLFPHTQPSLPGMARDDVTTGHQE